MEQAFPEAAVVDVDTDEVRAAIREEYREVAASPDKGFHFHTGRKLAAICGYREEWLEGIPEAAIESFAGTGNPFAMGELQPGERVVDIGSGAGTDSLIAGKMVGRTSDDEITVFDSTGIALQDSATVPLEYERAVAAGVGIEKKMIST